MKQKAIILIFIVFITACVPNYTSQETPIASAFGQSKMTVTPTIINSYTATITSLPGGTPTSSPTITPTSSSTTTVTPSIIVSCPKEDSDLLPWFPECDENGCYAKPYYEDVLSYLNMGGTLDNLVNDFTGIALDLTGDDKNEYLYPDLDSIFIYACRSNQYEIIFEQPAHQNTPRIEHIEDLNQNGLPEIMFSYFERYNFSYIVIWEWDGTEFISLIKIPVGENTADFLGMEGWNLSISDTNNDGLKEIITVSEEPARSDFYAEGLPWRDSTITLGWNGQNYVIQRTEYTSPEYRFQAIQDGDRATLSNEYDKALGFYQEAIFSNELDWWSKERKEYESQIAFHDIGYWAGGGTTPAPTLTPLPISLPEENVDEYYQLSAYAYYRMIINHIFLGEMDAAEIKFSTMQEKFSAINPGYPYLEMAAEFWSSFELSEKVTTACAAAINYANKNPSLLIPLGSDYHGWQSLIYEPEDVCPFK